MTDKSKRARRWYRSPKLIRHAVMLFFFVFLAHIAIEHQLKGGGPRGTPSVEAYCPFGGLESLYQFITMGGFIRRIEPSAMVLLAAVILLTLLASRGFCGWICPFGSVQEWIGLAGKKMLGKRFNPTGRLDRTLRYLKYVVLTVIIALTWHTGSLVFRSYDPFLAFFHFGQGTSELPWAYALLGVVLAGSLVVERFFCKYACPLGAVLGIVGKAGLTRIERNPSDCKECNLCTQRCHAHVDFLKTTSIKSAECNQCMDCVVDCPRPGVLTLRGPRWRFSHPGFAAVLVVGLAVFVGAGKLSGTWRTKPEAISFTNAAGKPDPESIRGWMTLQEIGDGYQMPLDQLYLRAGIPVQVPAATPLNKIARSYNLEFEPESLREVVRGFADGRPAAQTAKTVNKPSAGSEDQEVRGFMTLSEVSLKTGVPVDFFRKTLKLPADIDARKPVREWMHSRGMSIQDLRDAVAKYRGRKNK